MSLPNAWVDRIFDQLSLIYGSFFRARWAGMDIADVKTNWAHELARFVGRPDAIAYALANLPTDQPPTVLQFRAICSSVPTPQGMPALPAPSQEGMLRVAAALKAGMRARASQDALGPRAWMRELERDVLAGTATPGRRQHYAIARANGYFSGPPDGQKVENNGHE